MLGEGWGNVGETETWETLVISFNIFTITIAIHRFWMVPARSNLASILGGQLCAKTAKKTPTLSNISPNPPSTTIKQLQCYMQTPPAKNDHVRKWWWFPNWRGETYFTLRSPYHLNKRNLLTRTHTHAYAHIIYHHIIHLFIYMHIYRFWHLSWEIFWHQFDLHPDIYSTCSLAVFSLTAKLAYILTCSPACNLSWWEISCPTCSDNLSWYIFWQFLTYVDTCFCIITYVSWHVSWHYNIQTYNSSTGRVQ